jgi:hypothetical protein
MDGATASGADATAGGSGDSGGGATEDGGTGSAPGSGAGCSCRIAQPRNDGSSPLMLAFGAIALLGGAGVRRRGSRARARRG